VRVPSSCASIIGVSDYIGARWQQGGVELPALKASYATAGRSYLAIQLDPNPNRDVILAPADRQ